MAKETGKKTAADDREFSPEREAAEILKLEAERERALAAAAKDRTEAAQLAIGNRIAEAQALTEEMKLEETAFLYDRSKASDRYHHVYRFNGGVDSSSVKACIDELTLWHRMDPECDIKLVINSPGGSVFAGLDLHDVLLELRQEGHFITTHTRGMAASMGGILLQAGSIRTMGREAQVLIHEVSTMSMGKIGEIEDEVALVKKVQRRVLNIFAARSAEAFQNGTSEIALTAEQFDQGDKALGVRGWSRRDWWLDSDEALRFGVVDELV